MTIKIGFIVNPIAGIGGKRAWKGTDGIEEAWTIFEKEKYAYERVEKALSSISDSKSLFFYYCSDPMGESILQNYPFKKELVYSFAKDQTTAEDTKNACKLFLDKKVDLIVFVGGDGTARDILTVVNQEVPIVGIPSGVKMFSGCFLQYPTYLGEIIKAIESGEIQYTLEDVLDVDEELFRNGQVSANYFGSVLTPVKGGLMQGGKIPTGHSDEIEYESIAEDLKFSYDILNGSVILGTGSTVYQVMKYLGFNKTLLGVDFMENGKIIAEDVDEETLYNLAKDKEVKILLSPIGGQGFLLGRGNQQISARVINGCKKVDLIVVSTSSKVQTIESIKIDLSGEVNIPELNNGFIRVLTAYHQYKVKKVKLDKS